MGHEAAVDLPTQAFDIVFGEQEGKLLLDLGHLPVAAEHIVPGHPAPYFLLEQVKYVFLKHLLNQSNMYLAYLLQDDL